MSAKSKFLVLLVITAFLLVLPQNVHAVPTVTITPSPSQGVPQGSTATFTVAYAGGVLAATYAFSLTGLYPGASYSFGPSTPAQPAIAASSILTIDASSVPGLYCPGTYPFTVYVTNTAAPADTGSASDTLIVSQVGPPLGVSVSTDKPAYMKGDSVRIVLSVNRPSEGTVTVSPPGGAPKMKQFATYAASSGVFWTLTADQPYGTYTVNVQADDYCSGVSSASTTFTVSPDTYDVAVSISGVPSQFSAKIQVNGQNQGTVGGSQSRTLSFKVGTSNSITVDQYVAGDTGIRYYCSQNSWSVSSADSHTFNYQTQYQLTVIADPNGITPVTGGGWYDAGASVQTNQVAATVQGGPGTQYGFKNWEVDGVAQSGNPITLTMDKPHTAIAKYTTQYQLVVDSPGGLGNPQGAGFYDAGSTATFSVASPVGFLVQQVFLRWEGDYAGTSPQGSVMMDKPKVVHAVWMTSYTQAYIAGGIAVVAILAAVFLMMRRKKRGPGKPERSKPSKGKGLGLRMGKPKGESES